MKKVYLWLMLLMMSIGGFAQSTTITIGNGTTTSYYAPFGNWWANSWVQMIYPASAITENGFITSIGFQVSDVPTSAMQFSELHIYMGTSQDSVNSSTTSWLPMSNLSEVFTATNMPLPSVTGWMTIDLDEPFPYDGTQNLVIVVSKKMSSYTSALKFNYTSVSNAALYRGSDSDASYANFPGSSTGTRGAYRPNLQLTISANADFCHSVSGLAATEITSSDATISWAAPEDAYSFILQYKTSNQEWDDDDVVTLYPTDTAQYLTGLESNTHYQVRVANVCTGENSNWKTVSFKTECVAISVANEPYYEQFEGYATNSFPDCWTRLAGYNNYPYVNNASTTAHGGTGYFYFYNNPSNPIIVALPEFVEDLSTLRLSFWMKPAGTTNYYGHVDLGVMTDLEDPTTFTLLDSWSATEIGSSSWAYYEMNLDTMLTDETGYLVFRRYTEGSSTYAWYFDDVKVMLIPTCEAPTELEFNAATTNSVTLKWNPGDGTNFTVYYKVANSTDEYTAATGATLDGDSLYTLTGLNPATNYSIYVATDCGDGSETFCDPIICATTMIPVSLPYTTDFSEDADQNWLLNNGTCLNYWTMGTLSDTTASALFITNNGTSSEYSVASAISMVSASKLFTIGTAPQVTISFDVKVGGESNCDYIKLFFAPETESYPAKAGTTPTSSEYGYNSYSTYAFDFSDYASFSTYTSTTSYPYRYNLTGGNVVHIDAIMPNPHANPNENSTAQVVFAWKNDNSAGTQPGAIIYNVHVEVPSCNRPENITASNVTPHSADLAWNGGDATSWQVEYGIQGFTLGSGTIVNVSNTPETSLTNLTDNTVYDVYIKAICDDQESPNKTFSFETPCVGLTTVPQTWTFDSNLVAGTTSYPLPGCWTRITNSSTSVGYPYSISSSSYAHSGSRALYFYNGYTNCYAIMPAIDASALTLQNLQISFYARCSTASTYPSLEVGVMTDPNDPSTFTMLQSFSLTASYTTDAIVVPFSNYTGNGQYIAFRNTSTGSASNSFYIDDVTLEVIPACSKALYLTATPATHEAELTWMATGSTFDLHYKASDEDNYTVIQGVTLTDNYYTLNGLTSGTQYSWYIVTNCDDNTTFTSDVATFVTECEPLTILPQTWNFDDNLFAGTASYPLPVCWSRITTSTTTTLYPYAYSTTSYAHSGGRALYFYNSYLNSFAILPEIDLNTMSANQLQVSFFGRLSTTNDNVRLVVGVMDSPNSDSTFVGIDTIALTNAYSVDPFVVRFDEYEGNGAFIAFKNITLNGSTVANSIYIDDVTLEEIPVCAAPVNTVGVPTSNSIMLRWDNMDEGVYNIYFKADTDDVYLSIENVSVSDDYFTIPNLDPTTTYNFYVETICGDGTTSATNEYTVTTLCEIFTTPFVEDFNANNALPACWEKRAGLVSNVFAGASPQPTTSGWVFNNTNVFGQYHPKLNIYGTSANYWLISPEIDLSNLTDPALIFNLALTKYNAVTPIADPTSQQDDKFMVIISTDHGMTWSEANATIWSNDTNTADFIYNQISYTGQEVIIPLEDYAGQTIRIAFYGESTVSGGDNDLHIDNVVVGEEPSCAAPSNVAVDSITSESVFLSWDENGDATSWQVEYGTAGFTPGTGTTLTANTNEMFAITGLSDATSYDVYVSAVCNDNTTSNPSTKLTFKTECLPITLPYSQNFDSYSTGSTAEFVLCWKRFNTYSATTNYPYVSSTYSASGSNSLYFYCSSTTYSMAVLPQIDPTVNPINTLQLSFNMRSGATSYKLEVGAMTNPLDASTFVPIQTVEVSAANTFEPKVVVLSSYTGNGSYLALRQLNTSSSYATTYVDDIYLESIPSCPRPSDLTITAATTTSATLSWTAGGTETAWEIAYGPAGFDPDSVTVVAATSNPFTVQNLSASTMYEFYVRAICSTTDHSNWSEPAAGATECGGPVSLPYTENFEGYPGTSYDAPGVAPVCWTTISTNATYGAPHITGSGSYHYVHSGTNSMVFTCGSAGADAYAALPTFTNGLNTLHLNFWRQMESASSGTLTVGYVTDLTDMANTFVTVATIPSVTSTAADTISVDFTGADIPATGNICFHWNYSSSFYSCCIDDIEVTSNGSAPVITDPTVATTAATAVDQTTATLNGTITNPDNVTITAKGFEWKTTTGGTYQPVNVTGNTLTYNLTGLAPATGYTYKAFITFNGTTVYGDEVSFTTLPQGVDPCDVPTGLHTTSVENNAISIAWDANANVNSWNIQYRVAGQSSLSSATANTNSYTISGLNGNTDYEIQVQANCGDGNLSDWSAFITAHTTNVGIENHLENSVVLFPNPAREYVDVRIDGDVNVTLMEVYDVYGKLISNVNVVENPTRINVSGLANGMYFVRVTTEAGTVTKSFVKK